MSELYRLKDFDETSRAAEVLTDAFADDPLWRKAFEGVYDYHTKFSAFAEAPLRYSLKYGSVYAPSPNFEGVAAVVPGCHAQMGLWGMLRSRALFTGMKMGNRVSKRLMPLWKVLGEDRKEIVGGRDFLYLMIIGVAKKYQGQGHGKKLLNGIIEESVKRNRLFYLETETV